MRCGATILLRGVVDTSNSELKLLAGNIHNRGGKAWNICRGDAHGDAECSLSAIAPSCLHNAVGVTLTHTAGIRAVAAVDSDACVDSHKAEDIITLDRVAATAELILYIIYALIYDQSIGVAHWLLLLALLTKA